MKGLLTKEEFDKKISNNDYDFSNFKIDGKEKYNLTLLNNREVNFSNSFLINLHFLNLNLSNSNFGGSIFNNVSFDEVELVNSIFEFSEFNNTFFERCNLFESIFNFTKYFTLIDNLNKTFDFNFYFKNCNLVGTYFLATNLIISNNLNLKEKGIIYNHLTERNYFLQKKSEMEIKKLTESFEKLEKKFRNEEYFWLGIIFFTFIGLGFNIFFYIISNNDYFKFLPSIILLFTFLYFINSQFKTAKKLRIENQNKVALLYGMIGIKADTDKDMDKNIFYQNVANIVFSKVYEGKEENLPLDKVLELVKIINYNNKK